MSGGSLTDEPGGEPRYELAGRGGRIVGLRGGAHEARADDHAVGAGARRGGRLLGRRDAEAERDGHLGVLACTRARSAPQSSSSSPSRSPVVPTTETV